MYFMERMETPYGWHTMGIPLVFSILCNVLSYAMMGFSLCKAIFYWLGLPGQMVFAALVPGAALYSVLLVSLLTHIARGYQLALKIYLVLIFLTLVLAIGNLILVLNSPLFFASKNLLLIYASGSLLLSIVSIRLINSTMFRKTIAYNLHNRIWRWLLAHAEQQVKDTIKKK